MPRRDLKDMERELKEAGHQTERTYEAPVMSQQTASDAEWVFRVDGKVVARGRAMSALEEELARWMEETGAGG